jgi:hypothetical protein
VEWLFFAIFGPLAVASLVACGEDSGLRFWKPARMEVPREDAREFWRFLRSHEPAPDRFREAARIWADDVMRRRRCRWDRYSDWAWVLWISAGLITAVVWGGPRDVAPRLILFDLMLLAVRSSQWSRRRAEELLASQ